MAAKMAAPWTSPFVGRLGGRSTVSNADSEVMQLWNAFIKGKRARVWMIDLGGGGKRGL